MHYSMEMYREMTSDLLVNRLVVCSLYIRHVLICACNLSQIQYVSHSTYASTASCNLSDRVYELVSQRNS